MLDTLVHVSDLLTLFGVIVGVLIFYRTRRDELAIQRAAFLREYTESFYGHTELARTFQQIDYETYRWGDDDLGRAGELCLTQLLDLLNSVGFNCENHVLELDDVDETTLGYAIVRTFENREVRRYLEHVDNHSKTLNMNVVAFAHFRNLAQNLAIELRRSTP